MIVHMLTVLHLNADRRAVMVLEYGLIGAAVVSAIAVGLKAMATG